MKPGNSRRDLKPAKREVTVTVNPVHDPAAEDRLVSLVVELLDEHRRSGRG